jgi:uncharacterized membrane protein
MDLKVDVVAKAFKKKGVMTDIRTIWNFREQSKDQLVNWFALRDDIWTIDALTGRLTNGFDYVADSAANTTVYTNGSARVLLARDGAAEIVADADLTECASTTLSQLKLRMETNTISFFSTRFHVVTFAKIRALSNT